MNAFAKNDWVLNYLFRATSGGVGAVAGLRPIEDVPGLENVDVTDKIAGHMSYRTFMPLILDQLGFPVFADYFDEPEVGKIFLLILSSAHSEHRSPISQKSVLLFGKRRRKRNLVGSREKRLTAHLRNLFRGPLPQPHLQTSRNPSRKQQADRLTTRLP